MKTKVSILNGIHLFSNLITSYIILSIFRLNSEFIIILFSIHSFYLNFTTIVTQSLCYFIAIKDIPAFKHSLLLIDLLPNVAKYRASKIKDSTKSPRI